MDTLITGLVYCFDVFVDKKKVITCTGNEIALSKIR